VSYEFLLSKNQLRQAYKTIKGMSVPNMPDVVVKVNQEIGRQNTSPHKVAELITSDIALAGNVLKLANSPLYRRRAEIQSVEHATMMLGLTNLKNLVIASAFKRALANNNADYRQIEEDSQIIAHCASGIAAMVDDVAPEDAYLSGLFHDAGMMLLAQKFGNYLGFMEKWEDDPIGVIAAEEEQFGTNHCVVGFMLAKHWELPESVCYAISQHHLRCCDHIEDPHLRGHIAVLKLANYLLASTVTINTVDDMPDNWVVYRETAIKELALDHESVNEIRSLCSL
jgi:HD-like signal output (HDOD) protein